ncbi:MAG: hypothetical protein HYV27_12040 [Candidatus Hydrogenedentes bacterium]|nr:hypothetical protein [Candidatus Hydrogenedentota bacterium]
MLLNEVIIPILGPAFFAGILWLAVWGPWRTAPAEHESPTPIQHASLALALGVGLLLGYLKLAGWPPFPAKTASQWLALLAIAWAVLGYGVALLEAKRGPRMAVVAALALIGGALQSQVLMKHTWSVPVSVLWLAVFAVLVLLASEALSHAARRQGGASAPIAGMLGAMGLFGSMLLSYSAFLGQLSAMLVSMMGAAVVVSWISKRFTLAGPGVTVFYVFYLSLIGHGYFYSTLPGWTAILLALAPFASVAASLPAAWPQRSWKAFFVSVLLSGALAGGATYIAYAARMAKVAAGGGSEGY